MRRRSSGTTGNTPMACIFFILLQKLQPMLLHAQKKKELKNLSSSFRPASEGSRPWAPPYIPFFHISIFSFFSSFFSPNSKKTEKKKKLWERGRKGYRRGSKPGLRTVVTLF